MQSNCTISNDILDSLNQFNYLKDEEMLDIDLEQIGSVAIALNKAEKFTPPNTKTGSNILDLNWTNDSSKNILNTGNNIQQNEKNFSASKETFEKCDLCPLFLENVEELNEHVKEIHKNFILKCKECNQEFWSVKSLQEHSRAHPNAIHTRRTAEESETIICKECNKVLKLKSLRMHKKIHENEKKYLCDICGLKFIQKINLVFHRKLHSKELPYKCPECNKLFSLQNHLDRHKLSHTTIRPYNCNECDKTFKTEHCLKTHSIIHFDKRPYACDKCEKNFSTSTKLREHLNVHTGQRPYKCEQCDRTFTNYPNFLKHKKRIHNQPITDMKLKNLRKSPRKNLKPSNSRNIITEVQPRISSCNVENFSDLYSLSTPSAQELLIEHTFRMEELDNPNNSLQTAVRSSSLGIVPNSEEELSQDSEFDFCVPTLPPFETLNSFTTNLCGELPSLQLFGTTLSSTNRLFNT